MPASSSQHAFGIQSAVHDVCGGTLLWIGDRRSLAFRHAYEFCEQHVSQMAFRRNLESAIERPATDVKTILYCRENDSANSVKQFHLLCRRHDQAERLLLLGPLCTGSRPSPGEVYDCQTIWWHCWESTLPDELRGCGVIKKQSSIAGNLAIVSRDYAMADALVSIASLGTMSVVTIRPEMLSDVRRIDEYWWDDTATSGRSFENLIERSSNQASHVWITNLVSPTFKHQALNAGFSQVIAKPGDYRGLIARVRGVAGRSERSAA